MNKPFLKWAGGKTKVVDKLLPHFDLSLDTLIEPFCGAGAVFLNTNYLKYILNDINSDVINLYRVLKKEGQDF